MQQWLSTGRAVCYICRRAEKTVPHAGAVHAVMTFLKP